ncbi:unnamed protein product [Caretta caretta]
MSIEVDRQDVPTEDEPGCDGVVGRELLGEDVAKTEKDHIASDIAIFWTDQCREKVTGAKARDYHGEGFSSGERGTDGQV